MRKTSAHLPGLSQHPQQISQRHPQAQASAYSTTAHTSAPPNDVEEGEVSDHLDPFNPPTGPRLSRQNSQRAIPTLPTLSGRSNKPPQNQSARSQKQQPTKTIPQRPLPIGFHKISNDAEAQVSSRQSDRGSNATQQDHQSAAGQGTPQPSQQNPQTSRELAQGFIRTWHANGYTFDQMTAADPNLDALFLKEMYDEIGVPIVTTNKALLAPKAPAAHTSSTSVNTPSGPIGSSSQTSAAPSAPAKKSQSQASTTALDTSSKGALNLPKCLPEPGSKPNAATILQKPLQGSMIANQQGSKPASSLVDTPASPSTAVPQPTRQDYIARLMAAKTRKPESSPATSRDHTPHAQEVAQPSNKNSQHTTTLPASTQDPVLSKSTLPAKPPPPADTSTQKPAANGSQNLDQSIQSAEAAAALAKRDAQTALLKAKMTALREKNKATKAVNAATPAALDDTIMTGPMEAVKPLPPPRDVQSPMKLQAADSRMVASSIIPPSIAPDSTPQKILPGITPHAPASFSGRIPGLGLHLAESTSSKPQVVTTAPNDTAAGLRSDTVQTMTPDVASLSRKRPAANDALSEIQPPTKRPFGPARGVSDSEPMIIEVSEDEAGSVESQVDAHNRGTTLHNFHRQTTHEVPAVSEVNDHRPQSSIVRPQLDRNHSSNPEHLRKQQDLLEMKKKLAALQLRKRQAKIAESGSAPPDAEANSVVPSEAVFPHLGDKLDHVLVTAVGRDTVAKDAMLIETALPRLNQPSFGFDVSMDNTVAPSKSAEMRSDLPSEQTMATVPPALSENTAPPSAGMIVEPIMSSSPNHLSDVRARRRLEIEAQRQAKEASFAKKTTELEAMRAQMQELENALRKEREENDQLTAELESLGMDIQGMNPNEMREMKDDLVADAAAKGVDLDSFKTKVDTAPPPLSQVLTGSSAASMSISSTDDSGLARRASEDVTGNFQERNITPEADSQFIRTPKQRTDGDADMDMVSEGVDHLARAFGVSEAPRNLRAKGLNADKGEVVEGETQSDDVTMRQSSAESGEIASSSSSAVASPTSIEIPQNRNLYSLDGHFSPPRDTPSSMEEDSDAGSDGYEPPEPCSGHESPSTKLPRGVPSSSASVSEKESIRSGRSQSQTTFHQEDTPFSGFADEDEDEEYDPEDSLPPVAPHHDSTEETQQTEDNGRSPPTKGIRNEHSHNSASETGADSPHQAEVDNSTQLHDDGFVPYRSAFRNFNSFTSAGPRPNTTTNDIDPYKTWCQFEAAGGVCNDTECDDQHFRSMVA